MMVQFGFLLLLLAAVTVFTVGAQVTKTGEETCASDVAAAATEGTTANDYRLHSRHDTEQQQGEEDVEDVKPFELFEEFDIGNLITGTEGWWDLVHYKGMEDTATRHPSLSFYNDKVARKRWWDMLGYEQPKAHLLKYRKELTTTSLEPDEEEKVILNELHSLTNLTDYVAKPNHLSHNEGTWLVSHHAIYGTASVSRKAKKLNEVYHDDVQVKEAIAASLAQNLRKVNRPGASAVTRNVNPGVLVEERWTHPFHSDHPPMEFNMFCIWGRLWLGVWSEVQNDTVQLHANVYRNGTTAKGSAYKALPDWIDFDHMVKIAEQFSTHKDLLRTDIFVGIPAGSVKPGATKEERLAAVKIGVNEFELSPKTHFFECGWNNGRCENAITKEGARLWIAGYKSGNYKVVPNNEIPKEWLESGGYYSSK